jgi:hypothetical protein
LIPPQAHSGGGGNLRLVCPVAQVSWAIAFGSAVGSTLQAIVDAT